MYHNHDIYIQVSQRNSPFLLTKSEAYHLKPLHKHTNTEPLAFEYDGATKFNKHLRKDYNT